MDRIAPNLLLRPLAAGLGIALLASLATPQTGLVARGPVVLDSRWTTESFEEIDAGRWHTLARRADGTAVGWGESALGECAIPALPAGTTYLQVAAGGSWLCVFGCTYHGFSAGLRSDGSVVVWGSNEYDEHDVPALPPGVEYVQVAAGSHLLALRSDGQLVGWGDDTYGQTNAPALPSGLAYVQVDVLAFNSVALRSDGSVVDWPQYTSPVPPLPSGVEYVEVAAGYAHRVARRSDGVVVAWGDNYFGQCDVPPLPSGLTYVEVAAGWHHTLARRSDGSVVAWGKNLQGQCDVPAPPSGRAYVELAASETFSLGRLDDGTVVGWGESLHGELNVPELSDGLQYVQVAGGGHNPTGSLGFAHQTLVLTSDGEIDAFGYNSAGECDVPPLPLGLSYVEVGAGYGYSAARRSNGSIVRWGHSFGIPDVITTPSSLPYVELGIGAQFLLARRSDGVVQAWGSNHWGQTAVPTLPTGLVYEQVSAGLGHAVALRSDGSIAAWGLNDFGQTDVPAPPAGQEYVEVAAGWRHTAARLSDGTVVAWGDDSMGQCAVPPPPTGLTYVGIEAGAFHNVAQLSDGSVVLWGDDSNGQGSLPAPDPGLLFTGISAGTGLSAALIQGGEHGVSYCTSTPNSTGCAATIVADGNVSLAANDLTLIAVCVPNGFALFFHGPDQAQVPFGNGSLCIAGGLVRILPAVLASGGLAQTEVDLPSAGITTPGLHNFQCWLRDPSAGGAGFDTTNALAITFLP